MHMRSTLGSLHSQILILYTFLSLWMDLNKRGRTRRKRESKKAEPRRDVHTVDGRKRAGIKKFPRPRLAQWKDNVLSYSEMNFQLHNETNSHFSGCFL